MNKSYFKYNIIYCFIVLSIILILILYYLPKCNTSKVNKTVSKPHFFHYKNVLTDLDIRNLKSCICNNDKTINYKKMKELVSKIMKMKFPDYYWEKMRISTKSSNQIDASKIHRDIISNDYGNTTNMFYTVIIYLQNSGFSYIPNSNNKLEVKRKEKFVNVSKYDILMFDSTTLHRGIYHNRVPSKRTAIQIFNVIKRDQIDNCKFITNSIMSENILESLIYSKFAHSIDKRKIFNPRCNGTNKLLLMIEGGSLRTKKDIDKQNLYYMNTEFPVKINTIKSNLKKLYRIY